MNGLADDELEARLQGIQERMRPLEQELGSLRAQRELLFTERRRRERSLNRERRADLKAQMKEGTFPTVAALIANSDAGSFDEFRYNLKTGGEVRPGFPAARRQTVAFTDGQRIAQAQDLSECAQLYAAGWSLGSPGRPGIRVHFPGTRQEKLVDPEEVFARPMWDVG
jgi:hypothetical protein